MRIGTGIILLVVGAVLRFAITLPNPVIDLPTVGVILIGAGFVVLAFGIVLALRPQSTTETVVREPATRETAETLAPTRPYTRP